MLEDIEISNRLYPCTLQLTNSCISEMTGQYCGWMETKVSVIYCLAYLQYAMCSCLYEPLSCGGSGYKDVQMIF